MSSPLTRHLWTQAFRQRSVWLRHAADTTVVAKTIASPLIGFTLVLFSAAGTWVEKSLEQNSNPNP